MTLGVSTKSIQDRSRSAFLADALTGLSRSPKTLSPKFLYDRTGSLLFDAICELPEYYVTRTETAIMLANVREMVASVAGDRAVRLVEPGAGSGTKTRLLLETLGPTGCAEYVPIDISREHLLESAATLRGDLPWLRVSPVVADFACDLSFVLGASHANAQTLVYFPGSTIGNFEPGDARELLRRLGRMAGTNGSVLLGIDLKKAPTALHAAYNDARGITAAFNKNVLVRMNRELGASFDVDAFDHYAFFEPRASCIEMHLVSKKRQSVSLAGQRIAFDEGESICTERCYKYDLDGAAALAKAAGLEVGRSWLDDGRRFAVLYLHPSS